jgi:uncharacterized repeat protein (TIGR03803 family)
VQLPNGRIFGVTDFGGNNNMGTLFEFEPATNNIVKKVDFAGVSNGGVPAGSLLYFDTKLYGLTHEGGANNMGVLFEYDPIANDLTVKKHFNGALVGNKPVGNVMKAMDDKLYGMTNRGGAFNWGVIFAYDPATGDLGKVHDFTGVLADGLDVNGSLVESSNGKLYGVTEQGGTDNKGVLFEFDPADSSFTKKQDFIGANGARPMNGPLLFVSMENQTITFDALEARESTDQAFQLSAMSTSGLPISYTSSNGAVATVSGTTVSIKGGGTTTITAFQEGNIHHHAAPPVARTLTVMMVVGIEEVATLANSFPYPNPASHEFTIELDQSGSVAENSMTLFDALGRSQRIGVTRIDDKRYQCFINNVTPGLYYFVLPNTNVRRSIVVAR